MAEENKRERRFRCLRVRPEDIMILLGLWFHTEFVRLPKIKGLPEGYRVESVNADWATDSFLIRVSHPSFEEVEPMGTIPNFDVAEYEVVRLAIVV